MSRYGTITADMRINEVVRLHPETVRVFNDLGMDACCGGDRSIEEAAGRHGLELEAVLALLNERVLPIAG